MTTKSTQSRTHSRLAVLAIAVLLLIGLALPGHNAQAQNDADQNGEPSTAGEAASSPPAPIQESPIYKSRDERDMKLLADQLPEESVVWLEAENESFLAVYEPDNTGQPFGALLIIHDEGQHANWPHNIQTIRNALPDYGWATLTLSLPSPDEKAMPKRDPPPAPAAASENSTAASDGEGSNAAEPATDSASDESQQVFDSATGELSTVDALNANNTENAPALADPKVAAEIRAQARIKAAMLWLNEQGQFNIALLGDGLGALRASHYINKFSEEIAASGQLNTVRGLIMLSPRRHITESDITLEEYFKDPELPTLDIYFGHRRADLDAAKQRAQRARRAKFKVYQQLHLPDLARLNMGSSHSASRAYNDVNRLTQRIRGFLKTHARGVAVNNAQIRGNN